MTDTKEKSLEDKAKELQEENERLKEQLIDAKGIRHLVKDPYNESFYPTFDENSEAYKEAWCMYKGMKCAGMLHCEWDMCTVDFFIYFYMAGRKQALKDMMERIKGVTCYAACCECYMTDDFFTLESLKEIAEDLVK